MTKIVKPFVLESYRVGAISVIPYLFLVTFSTSLFPQMIAYCDFKYVFTFNILERRVQLLWNHTVHIFPFQKAATSGLGAWGGPGPASGRLASGSLITGAAPSTGHAFSVLHAAWGAI